MPRLSAAVLVPLLLLGLYPASSFAAIQAPQQTPALQGRVLDATGAPIPFARVSVRLERDGGQTMTILADGNGEFSVPVTSGVYAVGIAADGFSEAKRRVAVGSVDPAAMEIVLAVASLSETVEVGGTGDRVTVVSSATKTATPLRDIPQAVSIVSRELIAEQRMSEHGRCRPFHAGRDDGAG